MNGQSSSQAPTAPERLEYFCRALVEILENVFMDDDSNQLLEILDTVDEILDNNACYWSSPQLTHLLFDKLFLLIKCDRKELKVSLRYFIAEA